MNNATRKQIDAIVAKVHDLISSLEELEGDVDAIADEEQEKFDNMSEGLQQSENGQRIEAAADALAEAKSSREEAANALGELVSKLEEARDG